MGQMEESKDTQAILDGNEDNIRILLDEICALLPRFSRRTDLKSTAVDPYHDRLFLCPRILCLPYVQIQTRFTLRVKRPHLADASLLTGDLSKVIRLIHAVIAHAVHRCFPAKLTHGLFPNEGNALVSNDTFRLPADEGAVHALYRQRLVIISVRDLFVLAIQRLYSLCCLPHYVLVISNTCSIILSTHFIILLSIFDVTFASLFCQSPYPT